MPSEEIPADASVADVWQLLDEHAAPLDAICTPLADALGKVLRADILADSDQPPFDRSAMDGYAFFPTPGRTQYRVIGSIKAGDITAHIPGEGEALRIFTGAALPAPGLAVLIQEEARVEKDLLFPQRAVAPGENVRPRGIDARAGAPLVRSGTLLGPAELAIAASVGETQPLTTRHPRIAHATTGDELVAAELAPGPGQIRDSNRILIAALLAATGLPSDCLTQERWGDDARAASERLSAEPFASADIVLISGGVSVGEHDYAARALTEAGFTLSVRRVNSRPGRPLLVGRQRRRWAFGLPGNPVSHWVCFHLFVRRALALLAGELPPRWLRAKLIAPLEKAANRRPTYWPAILGVDDTGQITLRPLPWNNSGHLAALTGANALFHVPPNTPALSPGTLVDTLPVASVASL
jgi:molybdopterin molybdotransferase